MARAKEWLEKYGFYVFLAVLVLCLGVSAWALRSRSAHREEEPALTAMAGAEDAVLRDPLDPSRAFEPGEAQKVVWSETLSCWAGHAGWDLFCEEGTAVYALHAGEVVRMYQDAFLGNALIVRGEEGEALYAGLSDECALRVGRRVEAGELLGSVGESGLSEPGAPHLHLETYKTAATMPATTSDAQASR